MKLKIYKKENSLTSIIWMFSIGVLLAGLGVWGYFKNDTYHFTNWILGGFIMTLSIVAYFKRNKDLIEQIIEVEKYEEVQ